MAARKTRTAPAAPVPVRQPDPRQRDWQMVPGAGMVAADRPYVPPIGEERPAGGGPYGRDYACSLDDGPPVAADAETASASRPPWPRGTSN